MARYPSIQHSSEDTSQSTNKPKLPTFQPLPPTNILNRIINSIVAPLFYLFFTIIISIVVVPVYTVVQQIQQGGRSGRNKHGGERIARDRSDEVSINGHTQKQAENRVKDFLTTYGGSYGMERRKR